MSKEFIPTLGNLIKEIDSIIKAVPIEVRDRYAALFKDTEIERLIKEREAKNG
mgnify:CR=1 FL=1